MRAMWSAVRRVVGAAVGSAVLGIMLLPVTAFATEVITPEEVRRKALDSGGSGGGTPVAEGGVGFVEVVVILGGIGLLVLVIKAIASN